MAGQGLGELTETRNVLRSTRNRMLWRTIIMCLSLLGKIFSAIRCPRYLPENFNNVFLIVNFAIHQSYLRKMKTKSSLYLET